jgi:hypothetical protein
MLVAYRNRMALYQNTGQADKAKNDAKTIQKLEAEQLK